MKKHVGKRPLPIDQRGALSAQQLANVVGGDGGDGGPPGGVGPTKK